MAEPSLGPGTGDDTGGVGSDPGPRTGLPRWVKVFLIVAVLVVVSFVILFLTGGGHGPGRHMSTGGIGEPARVVEVSTLDTMTFEPNRISVSAGETITFAVTNTGQVVHEFTLGDAAMQQEHAEAMAHMPAGMVHDTSSSVSLQPGETKELTWRFGSAATLEFACHQPDHYEAGMHGEITIA